MFQILIIQLFKKLNLFFKYILEFDWQRKKNIQRNEIVYL